MIKLDLLQIFRKVFDEATSALKVKLIPTQMNLSFNHKEDSMESHPTKLVVKVEGVDFTDQGEEIIPPIDCSSLREVKLYCHEGSAKIMVSPEDHGDFFVEHDGGKLIARRLKVVSIDAIGKVHLVGRS